MKRRLEISGMHCVGCTMAVEGALEDLPGVKSANVHYARQVADVEYDEKQVGIGDIIAAIEMAGYGARPTTDAVN